MLTTTQEKEKLTPMLHRRADRTDFKAVQLNEESELKGNFKIS